MRRSRVRFSAYPSAIIHFIRVMFEVMYSIIGSLLSFTVQPAAERSAEASVSSKACSILRSGKPSISRMRPEKMFFLPFFSTVSKPCLMP